MDFYRFINSKDIREYHKEINYRCNAAEAAWLVWQCKDADIKEKHEAWQWIIDNMDDVQYAERLNYHCDPSIKAMLEKYMDFENRMIKEFFDSTDNNYLYVSKVIYRYSDGRIEYGDWSTWDAIYSDFEKCWNAVGISDDYYRVRICKKPVDSDKNSIELCFDPKDRSRIYELNLYKHDLNEDDENLYAYCFEGMWFDFPTPFRKGDIIWNPERPNNRHMCSGPFVNLGVGLEGIESERVKEDIRKYGDDSDMTAGGYFAFENGQIYREVTHNYMDMEFYPKRPEGAIRTLIPISNFLRGQIDLDLCVRAYHQIMMETMTDNSKIVDYLDEGLVLAGLKKAENIKIWLDDERTAPYDYYHCHSVNEAKNKIKECERFGIEITEINCDHDLGDYANDGGDGIKLIDWLAERGTFCPIVIHTMNPVGRDNMQREINRYWPEQVWKSE